MFKNNHETCSKTITLSTPLTGNIIDIEARPTETLTEINTEISLISSLSISSEVKKGEGKKETEETKKTFKNDLREEEKKPTSKTSTFNLDLSNLIELEKKDSIPTTGILTRSKEIDKNAINSHANIQTIVNEQNRAKVISDNDSIFNTNKDSLVIHENKHVSGGGAVQNAPKAIKGMETLGNVLDTFKTNIDYDAEKEINIKNEFLDLNISESDFQRYIAVMTANKLESLWDYSKRKEPENTSKRAYLLKTICDRETLSMSNNTYQEKPKEVLSKETLIIKKWGKAWKLRGYAHELGVERCQVPFTKWLQDELEHYSIDIRKRKDMKMKSMLNNPIFRNTPVDEDKILTDLEDLETKFSKTLSDIKDTGISYDDMIAQVDVVLSSLELSSQIKGIKTKSFFITNLSKFWKV